MSEMFQNERPNFSGDVNQMLDRLEGRIKKGKVEKTPVEKAIRDVSEGVVQGKKIVDGMNFDEMDSEQIANMTVAWRTWGKEGIFKGDDYRGLRVKLQKLLQPGSSYGSPELFARQIWRTEMAFYMMEKLMASNRTDKDDVVENIMSKIQVTEVDDEPLEVLNLAVWLDPVFLSRNNRARLAKDMTNSDSRGKVEDMGDIFGGVTPTEVKIVVGGDLVVVPLEISGSLIFKNLIFDEETNRIYGQMENGCKGNLTVIEVDGTPSRDVPPSSDRPGADVVPQPQPGADVVPEPQPGADVVPQPQPGADVVPELQPGADVVPEQDQWFDVDWDSIPPLTEDQFEAKFDDLGDALLEKTSGYSAPEKGRLILTVNRILDDVADLNPVGSNPFNPNMDGDITVDTSDATVVVITKANFEEYGFAGLDNTDFAHILNSRYRKINAGAVQPEEEDEAEEVQSEELLEESEQPAEPEVSQDEEHASESAGSVVEKLPLDEYPGKELMFEGGFAYIPYSKAAEMGLITWDGSDAESIKIVDKYKGVLYTDSWMILRHPAYQHDEQGFVDLNLDATPEEIAFGDLRLKVGGWDSDFGSLDDVPENFRGFVSEFYDDVLTHDEFVKIDWSLFPKIRSFHVSEMVVEDVSVLSSLENLEELYLGSTSISDLSFIADFTNLKRIDLGESQVSYEDVLKFKAENPNVEILGFEDEDFSREGAPSDDEMLPPEYQNDPDDGVDWDREFEETEREVTPDDSSLVAPPAPLPDVPEEEPEQPAEPEPAPAEVQSDDVEGEVESNELVADNEKFKALFDITPELQSSLLTLSLEHRRQLLVFVHAAVEEQSWSDLAKFDKTVGPNFVDGNFIKYHSIAGDVVIFDRDNMSQYEYLSGFEFEQVAELLNGRWKIYYRSELEASESNDEEDQATESAEVSPEEIDKFLRSLTYDEGAAIVYPGTDNSFRERYGECPDGMFEFHEASGTEGEGYYTLTDKYQGNLEWYYDDISGNFIFFHPAFKAKENEDGFEKLEVNPAATLDQINYGNLKIKVGGNLLESSFKRLDDVPEGFRSKVVNFGAPLGMNQSGFDAIDWSLYPNLEFVNLKYTKVNDLSPLSVLTNLRGLYLYETNVDDLSPLVDLPNLDFIYLEGTPLEGNGFDFSGVFRKFNAFVSDTYDAFKDREADDDHVEDPFRYDEEKGHIYFQENWDITDEFVEIPDSLSSHVDLKYLCDQLNKKWVSEKLGKKPAPAPVPSVPDAPADIGDTGVDVEPEEPSAPVEPEEEQAEVQSETPSEINDSLWLKQYQDIPKDVREKIVALPPAVQRDLNRLVLGLIPKFDEMIPSDSADPFDFESEMGQDYVYFRAKGDGGLKIEHDEKYIVIKEDDFDGYFAGFEFDMTDFSEVMNAKWRMGVVEVTQPEEPSVSDKDVELVPVPAPAESRESVEQLTPNEWAEQIVKDLIEKGVESGSKRPFSKTLFGGIDFDAKGTPLDKDIDIPEYIEENVDYLVDLLNATWESKSAEEVSESDEVASEVLDTMSVLNISKLKRLETDEGRQYFVLDVPSDVGDNMEATMSSVCNWDEVVAFNQSQGIEIKTGEAIRFPVDAFKTDQLEYKGEVWFVEIDPGDVDVEDLVKDDSSSVIEIFTASRGGRLSIPVALLKNEVRGHFITEHDEDAVPVQAVFDDELYNHRYSELRDRAINVEGLRYVPLDELQASNEVVQVEADKFVFKGDKSPEIGNRYLRPYANEALKEFARRFKERTGYEFTVTAMFRSDSDQEALRAGGNRNATSGLSTHSLANSWDLADGRFVGSDGKEITWLDGGVNRTLIENTLRPAVREIIVEMQVEGKLMGLEENTKSGNCWHVMAANPDVEVLSEDAGVDGVDESSPEGDEHFQEPGLTSKESREYLVSLKAKYPGVNPISFIRLNKYMNDPDVIAYLSTATYPDMVKDGFILTSDEPERYGYLTQSRLWDRKISLCKGSHKDVMKRARKNMEAYPEKNLTFEEYRGVINDVWEDMKPRLKKAKLIDDRWASVIDADMLMSFTIHEIMPTHIEESKSYNALGRVHLMRALLNEGLELNKTPAIHDKVASFGPLQTTSGTHATIISRYNKYMDSDDKMPKFEEAFDIEDQLEVGFWLTFDNMRLINRHLNGEYFDELYENSTPQQRRSFMLSMLAAAHNAGASRIATSCKKAFHGRGGDVAAENRELADYWVDNDPNTLDKCENLEDARIAVLNIIRINAHSTAMRHGVQAAQVYDVVKDL